MNESDRQGYVIITPAYNESEHIELAIQSVRAQSKQPVRWVIVDDGSTDGTGDIAQKAARDCPFIRYVYRQRMPGQTYFCSNVHAIMEGYEQCKELSFGHVAILDADISLPLTYYETILGRFEHDSKLGIASGIYENLIDGKFHKVLSDRRSTPKAIMVFRREVFEQIGGFLPLKYGGEDTCACFMARMKGWKVWSFPDLIVIHNKPVGTGHSGSLLKIRFRQGIGEYFLATHPLFLTLKAARRCILERPFLLSGIARMVGFIYGHFMGEERQIPTAVVNYIRKEQVQRVWDRNRIPNQSAVEVAK